MSFHSAIRSAAAVSHRPSSSQALSFVAAMVQQQSHIIFPLSRSRTVLLCVRVCHDSGRPHHYNTIPGTYFLSLYFTLPSATLGIDLILYGMTEEMVYLCDPGRLGGLMVTLECYY